MPSVIRSLLAAFALLAAVPAAADAAPGSLLAPDGACQGDRATAGAVQVRAMRCLVGAVRRRAGLSALRASGTLSRAADLKAGRIEACGSFSHTPCGAPFSAAFAAAGWHGRTMGENIAYGQGATGTPRAILGAWLQSPGHRANLLRPGFRLQGLAVRTAALPGVGRARVWVHAFGA